MLKKASLNVTVVDDRILRAMRSFADSQERIVEKQRIS